jgi:hypothetical protein
MQSALRKLIRCFDAFLRRAEGVFEFCDDEDCILRLQLGKAPHPVELPDCQVQKGDPVLKLHLWNERISRLPETGADLAWAAHVGRLFVRSLRAVAQQVEQEPRMRDVRAIGGVTVLFFPGDGSGGSAMMKRLGFAVLPYHTPLGRFGEFWENLYAWWLMWAYNPASLRFRDLIHLRRAEMWISADELRSRWLETTG